MRLLIYSLPGQAENVFPLFKALTEKHIDVTYLLANNNLKSTIFDVKSKITKKGIIPATSFPELQLYSSYMDMRKVYVVNDEFRLRTPIKSLMSILRVMWFIHRGRFDVVHTDFVFRYWNNLLYIFKKKISFLQHDPFEHTGMEFSNSTRKVLSRAHKLCSKFVILNKTQFLDYCQTYKIDPKRVLINKLGSMDCIKLFAKEGVKERKNNILFFGSITKYKGVEYLCQAMLKVHDVIPDATVTIAGGKPFYFDITPYNELPYFEIYNRFIEKEELVTMIQQCSVGVFPYTDSTQSGCVITCYTLGKPVIVSDIGTMREIVDEGESGLLSQPRNANSLASAIIALLKDDKKRSNMKTYIKDSYFSGDRSWDVIADKYIKFYDKKQRDEI